MATPMLTSEVELILLRAFITYKIMGMEEIRMLCEFEDQNFVDCFVTWALRNLVMKGLITQSTGLVVRKDTLWSLVAYQKTLDLRAAFNDRSCCVGSTRPDGMVSSAHVFKTLSFKRPEDLDSSDTTQGWQLIIMDN